MRMNRERVVHEIHEAIRESVWEAGWDHARLAVEIQVSANTAYSWLSRCVMPSGDSMERLRRCLPNLAVRLDAIEH